MQAKLIILMILIILFTIFVSNNTESVHVWFFFWPIYISKIVLLTITFAVGVITGLLVSTFFVKSQRKKAVDKKTKENMQNEIESQREKNTTHLRD